MHKSDKCSSFANCISGVPQGSILGPLLFSIYTYIYINDLPQACPDVNIQMYADDVVIFTHARSKEYVAAKLSMYDCMYFTARINNSVNPDILINDEVITSVTHVKYLGIIIGANLTFKKQVSMVIKTVKFNFEQL